MKFLTQLSRLRIRPSSTELLLENLSNGASRQVPAGSLTCSDEFLRPGDRLRLSRNGLTVHGEINAEGLLQVTGWSKPALGGDLLPPSLVDLKCLPF